MDKISQAQEKFSLLDRVPIGVCVLQSDKIVLFWNGCLEQWTKILRNKILGTCITDYFPILDRPKYANRLQQIFEGGPPTIFSSQLHKHLIFSPLPRGQSRIQHTTVTAVPALDGAGYYALLSIQDVTDLTWQIQDYRNLRDRALVEVKERKKAEDALLQVEADIRNALEKEKELSELKSRFVTMTSHEFRTPLSIISSSAGLLQDYDHKLDTEKKLKHLQRIQASVKHMTELLDDVFLIDRIQMGKLEVRRALLNLENFCRDLVEELQLSATQHTIIVSTHCIDALIHQGKGTDAYMDEKLLRQIFTNLLSNAIKYSPPGSTVYFELTCKDGEAIFQIRDEGIGILPEDQQKLFESFYRGKNVGTIPGTGLGLAIVKRCVDLHNGKITVASVPGVGTTVIVNIPFD